MYYLPIIGSFLEATGTTIEKVLMKKRNLNYKNYTVFGFLSIVLIMLTFVFFVWKVDNNAYLPINIILFVFVIAAALGANLLSYFALKRESLGILEPIRLMQPLLTIFLAIIFFPSERTNPAVIILAFIASITLVLSHIKKHHLVYDRYIIAAVLGSFLFAVELVLSKPLLQYYNPFTFYFLRCLFVFLITLAIFKPKDNFDLKTNLTILFTAGIWIAYRIMLYYGYDLYGIVFTTIVFILTPIFIYFYARIFLKEKLTWRNIIATIIIIACVVFAIILQNK